MQTYRLVAHPDHPPLQVKAVAMRWVDLKDGRSMLRYRVDGCGKLKLPSYTGKGRADELWQTTCFELFLGGEGPGYLEFNFSPSARWAAYFFASYRDGRVEPEPAVSPDIHTDQGQEIFVLTAFLATQDVAGATRAAITAVIEEEGGHKSWWALAHPPGQPDFHDPACFMPVEGAAGRP